MSRELQTIVLFNYLLKFEYSIQYAINLQINDSKRLAYHQS